MYQMTPPKPPEKSRKKLSFFQMLLIAAALGFLAWYLYTTFVPAAATTAVIEAGPLGARYTGGAVLPQGAVAF